jgi:hypothetical protein
MTKERPRVRYIPSQEKKTAHRVTYFKWMSKLEVATPKKHRKSISLMCYHHASHHPSAQSPSSSNPPHTRNNPHSTRIPPHKQSNSTALPDTPSDTRDPSSASAAAPAGTAGLAGVRSTFAAGAVARRTAWAGLVRIDLGEDRSCCESVPLRSMWWERCGGAPLLRVLGLTALVVSLGRHFVFCVVGLCRCVKSRGSARAQTSREVRGSMR